MELSKNELLRYSRHLVLPEVGLEGQRALKEARVLIVGLGGLGSPAALYLAAAGVGRIGIADFDVVDFSNLQRQIIHAEKDVGRAKVLSAQERLEGINSDIAVVLHEARLSSENALHILKQYDLVVDGTDNFPTRYLVNDACVMSGIPYVYGSIYQFEGQVSVLAAPGGPCYRCLFPEPPPPGEVPNCAEGGVLGLLPGVIGTLQATEAVKYILGIGSPLVGRLLYFDALKTSFREIHFKKSGDCPVCGDRPSVTELIDYEEFCGVREPAGTQHEEDDISPSALKRSIDSGDDLILLDVREPQEFAVCRIGNAVLIPMGDIPEAMAKLDRKKKTVVYCHHGIRSRYVIDFMKKAGFANLKNLTGGIDSWAREVEPDMPRY